jgi:hypothetical protein
MAGVGVQFTAGLVFGQEAARGAIASQFGVENSANPWAAATTGEFV